MARTGPSIHRGHLGAVVLCLGGLLLPAHADEKTLAKKLAELNAITGKDVVDAETTTLGNDKKGTPELLKHAVAILKKDKTALSYTAAIILADAAGELKDIANAEPLYEHAAAEALKLESATKLEEAYRGWIFVLYENKKFETLAQLCRTVLEARRPNAKPREVLLGGSGRFGEDTFQRLEEDYDALQLLRPGIHRWLLQALTKQGKTEQALKQAEQLIKASDHWRERELRASILREAGRFDDAATAYEDVIERILKDRTLEKERREFFELRYRYVLSNVYVDLKKVDKAAKELQTLIERKPDEPGYYNDLGYIWADHELKLDEAEKLIRKALELDRKRRKENAKLKPDEDRDNGAYLDSLGWVLFKQKRYKEAKEWLIKATEDKAAQHIEIFDHLADVHMALGEREAAITAWRRGLEAVTESRRDQERKQLVEKKLKENEKK